MKKLLIGLIIICLLVGGVNAWTIEDPQHRYTGSVDFYGDGTGVLNVAGGPVIDFAWHQSGDMIRATYLFYGVDVYYNASSDELWSPDVSGVVLKR